MFDLRVTLHTLNISPPVERTVRPAAQSDFHDIETYNSTMKAHMSPHIGIVTWAGLPELDTDDQPVVTALRHRGALPDIVVWNDPTVDWRSFDLLVVRSTWDYPSHLELFLTWHERVFQITPVTNASWTSRISSHKGYLPKFHAKGLPVIPTAIVHDVRDVRMTAVERGWSSVVVKPAVSLGNRSVLLVHDAEQTELDSFSSSGAHCVQPYLPVIATDGEYSIVCIDGVPSHAVIKRPARGDFRIHEKFGGVHEPHPLTNELAEFAERFITETGMAHELAARFDAIRDEKGELRLVEMDLCCPCMYFCHHPPAIDAFVSGVAARLGWS